MHFCTCYSITSVEGCVGCLQQEQCVKMPRPIELELDLGQHHFEEAVSGSDSSDENDSDDDGSEPTN